MPVKQATWSHLKPKQADLVWTVIGTWSHTGSFCCWILPLQSSFIIAQVCVEPPSNGHVLLKTLATLVLLAWTSDRSVTERRELQSCQQYVLEPRRHVRIYRNQMLDGMPLKSELPTDVSLPRGVYDPHYIVGEGQRCQEAVGEPRALSSALPWLYSSTGPFPSGYSKPYSSWQGHSQYQHIRRPLSLFISQGGTLLLLLYIRTSAFYTRAIDSCPPSQQMSVLSNCALW